MFEQVVLTLATFRKLKNVKIRDAARMVAFFDFVKMLSIYQLPRNAEKTKSGEVS